MIQLTTREGNILLAKVAADDAMTIQGLCSHGVSLFHDCWRCESLTDNEDGMLSYWQQHSEHFR